MDENRDQVQSREQKPARRIGTANRAESPCKDWDINTLTEKVIGIAIKVHRILGPGLLESAYEQAMMIEFRRQNIPAENQVYVPIDYEGETIDRAFRADIVVDDRLILELKSVKKVDDGVYKTLFTYLRLSHLQVGLVINFNVKLLKNGIKRIIV